MGTYIPVLLFLFLSFLPQMEAQVHERLATEIQFQHYSREQGLHSNEILAMAEDHQGYIWVGAVGGLYRFDGYEFSSFDFDSDTSSLQGAIVSYIYEDLRKDLWIGTLGDGLKKLDRKTGRFRHYSTDSGLRSTGVVRMLEDINGDFWIGTHDGLYSMNRDLDTFEYHPHDSARPERTIHIMSLDQSADGTLWVGTFNQGLFRFNPGEEKFSSVTLPFSRGENIGDMQIRIRKTLEDSAGDIWVGTTTGLFHLKKDSDEISTYKHSDQDSNSIIGSSIMDMLEHPKGQLWIATQSGLSKLHVATNTFQNFERNDLDKNSLSNNYVDNIIRSRQGIIWLGTGGGVNSIVPKVGRFSFYGHNRYFSDSEVLKPLSVLDQYDGAGEIWIGGPEGNLAIFDPFNHLLRQVNIDFLETEHSFTKDVTALAVDHLGNVWIGTRALGVFKYFPKTRELHNLTEEIPGDFEMTGVKITALLQSRDHSTWIATLNRGLIHYDPVSELFTQYLPDRLDSLTIGSSQPYYLTEDASGYIWIGLNHLGVDRLDPQTGEFLHFRHDQDDDRSLTANLINVIFEDKKGQIWIGTNRGLNMWSSEHSGISRFTQDEGFISSEISSIEEDADGQLWFATDQGMFRYIPEVNKFHKFDQEDGVPNQAFLWDCSTYDASSGQLIFGTAGGLLTFKPRKFHDNEHEPNVVISKGVFYRRNQNTSVEEDLWIQNKNEIQLDHDEDIMEFHLSALNFYQPGKNQYAYFLESGALARNESRQWFNLKGEHKLRFTNLSAGKHILRVRASNNDGLWSDQEARLVINISPPWWFSWWAILFYVAVALSIAYILRNMDLQRRLLMQKADLEHARAEEKQLQSEQVERQARQLQESLEELKIKNKKIIETQNQLIQQEKLASLGQLMGGIAHEIKNPLNFVNNFAEGSGELLEDLITEVEKYRSKLNHDDFEFVKSTMLELKENAADILNHGNRLNRIVNGMLDQARGGNDERRSLDLHHALDDHIELAYHGFRAKEATFNVRIVKDYDGEVGSLPLYGQDFGRVIINLLNNAFYSIHQKDKRTNADYHPEVAVSTRKVGQNVQISIMDNGCGIAEDSINRIFEPFFTTKPTGSGNTGLGLYISYDIIVNRHGGEMTVNSREQEFTEFIMKLPGKI